MTSTQNKDYSKVPTLAILPFDGVDENESDILAQLLSIEIANSGKYAVLPRTSIIESIMQEHEFQRNRLTEPKTIVPIEIASADYVLSGSLSILGSTSMVSISIIDVSRLVEVAALFGIYKTIKESITLMSQLSYDLTGVKSSIDKTKATTSS